MTGILPYWVPDFVFLSNAESFISPVRQILRPILTISVPVDFPMKIFSLQDKYTETRYNDVVYLSGIIPVFNQYVIKHLVRLTR